MTSLFDGMATLLNGAFGGVVTLAHPSGALQTNVPAVFRAEPLELTGEAGLVLIEQPTLRIRRDIAPEIQRGTHVTLPDGRRFRVESRIPGGSPAEDAFIICTLEARP